MARSAEELRDMLAHRDTRGLRLFIEDSHPGRVAEALAQLEPSEIIHVLRHARKSDAIEVFEFFSEETQEDIFEGMARKEMAEFLEEMASDDRADLVKRLKPELAESVLALVAQVDREDIRRLSSYREGTAGAIMTTEKIAEKIGGQLTYLFSTEGCDFGPRQENCRHAAQNMIEAWRQPEERGRFPPHTNARAVYNYYARLKQKMLLNDASTVSTYKLLYNGVAQITSALYRNAADTATIIGYEHGYDKVGNPAYEIRVHQSSEGDAYMYDNLYRVTRTIYDDVDPTSPTYASARTDDWLLDDIDNRTKVYAKSATSTEYEHNAVNEYTSVGGTEFAYDAAGNLTRDDTHYYYWDYENRLTKVELVSDNSDVAEYTYDAMMRRVEKVDKAADPDVTTQFFYDGLEVIEERQSDGTLNATYINGPRIDEPILMNRDSTDYWYVQSPLNGSVAALVNSSGGIQEGYKYRAYGAPTILTGAGNDSTWFTSDDATATTSSVGNPYMYTARRYDEETGLMYFRRRMYNPETGSFISRDPVGYVDGMSLYLGYFAPKGRDPLGLDAFRQYRWAMSCDASGREFLRKDAEARRLRQEQYDMYQEKAMEEFLLAARYRERREEYLAKGAYYDAALGWTEEGSELEKKLLKEYEKYLDFAKILASWVSDHETAGKEYLEKARKLYPGLPDVFLGLEGGFLFGLGTTKVRCTDENNCVRVMNFKKYCAGGIAGVSATAGSVRGLDGEACKPDSYSGWFFENGGTVFGVSLGCDIGLAGSLNNPLNIGEEGDTFSGVWEVGAGAGAGAKIKVGVFCYYVYQGDD